MKMKKRRLLALLLIAVLCMAMVGCKKDKTADEEDEEVTPTEAPVTIEELYESAGKQFENVADFEKLASGDLSELNIPDLKADVKVSADFDFNLLGIFGMNGKLSADGDITSKANIAQGKVTIALDAASTSMFSTEESRTNETETNDFYIDNTGDEMLVYFSSDDGATWEYDTVDKKEALDGVLNSVGEQFVETEGTDTSKYFSDLTEFSKEHTTLKNDLNGYTITSDITWKDVFDHYKDDILELVGGVAPAVTGSEASDETTEQISKILESGTGEVKADVTFDKDKKLTGFKYDIKDFGVSTEYEIEGESYPIVIKLNSATIEVKLSYSVSDVAIPDTVRDEAVLSVPVSDYDSDYDWDDSDYDWDDSDYDWDDSDYDWDDSDYDATNDVREEDGVYYINIGDDEVAIRFPEDWEVEPDSYFINVTPADYGDSVFVYYSNSYVYQGDGDTIREYADSMTEDGQYCEVVEVPVNGCDIPGYAIFYGEDDFVYGGIFYMPGSVGMYYLMASVYSVDPLYPVNELVDDLWVVY